MHAHRAAAHPAVLASSRTDIDGILYYQPEGTSPMCGSGGTGILGVCYIGVVTAASYPPYTVSNYARTDASGVWSAGCFVRYQRPGVAAQSNIGTRRPTSNTCMACARCMCKRLR